MQGAHVPPQSMLVSSPSFTRLVQLGGTHCPLEHLPVAQSAPDVQPATPVAQGGHEPPQSTAFSVPFFTLSVHEVASTECDAGMHAPMTRDRRERRTRTVGARWNMETPWIRGTRITSRAAKAVRKMARAAFRGV